MSTDVHTGSELRSSPRFRPPEERRDFLGMAALWSAMGALGVALLGALRLPMPSVFPESSSRVKLGPVEQFTTAEVTPLPQQRMWVFSDAEGLYAISAICTHLGCIVSSQESGGFFCPCHGSKFDREGKVVSGPAPRALTYLDLFVSPDGQLVVDQQKQVAPEARVKV